MSALIRYENISKRYPLSKRPAVDNVSLSVKSGEMLALVGESGSGKTTLLRLAAGLESPTGGSVSINGKIVAGPGIFVPPEKRSLGMIFQEGALFPHMRVADNIAYGIWQRSAKQRRDRVGAMLALVGLSGYEKRFPHELSGGERQRVALARALAPEPAVIFLDEPFSSLDATLRRSLRDDVCGVLKQIGATAILVVHDPEDALSVGDRVAVLKHGVLVQISSAQEAYYQPTSDYCAQLFGPANALTINGCVHWFRPEQFRVGPEGEARSVAAVIERVRNIGRTWEVLAHPACEHGKAWLLHIDLKKRPCVGDRVGVSLPEGILL